MAIPIDAHVHIYPEFNKEQFFSAAFDNFLTVEKRENLVNDVSYVLALAEGGEHDVFSTLYENAVSPENRVERETDSADIIFYKTAEPNSFLVCRGESTIILLAGTALLLTRR